MAYVVKGRMDEAQQIVVRGLEQAGVDLPPGVDGVPLQDLTSSSLFSLCSQALSLILPLPKGLPLILPQTASERFRACSQLAVLVKQLGYKWDLSFHQLLYPSEEESHKLLRFLFDTLSKSSSSQGHGSNRKSRGRRAGGGGVAQSSKSLSEIKRALSVCLEEAHQVSQEQNDNRLCRSAKPSSSAPFRTCPLRLARHSSNKKSPALITLQAKPRSWLAASVLELNAKNALYMAEALDDQNQLASLSKPADDTRDLLVFVQGSLPKNIPTAAKDGHIAPATPFSRALKFSSERDGINLKKRLLQEQVKQADEVSPSKSSSEELSTTQKPDSQQMELLAFESTLNSLREQFAKMMEEAGELEQRHRGMDSELKISSEELKLMEEEHSILKTAVKLALVSESKDIAIQKAQAAVEASQQQLDSLHKEWEIVYSQLEEKKSLFGNAAEKNKGEIELKLRELKNVRQQIKDISEKIRRREELSATFSAELENAAGATRNGYLRRVTELIKNSKKQDADISRIISETRNLQRENNLCQGRLQRTYALVDELIFRDAKKDPVGRQAYRLLTSIHEIFADCFEEIFAIDKVQREISELQAALESLEKLPMDASHIQADIDAIMAENEALETEFNQN